MNVNQNQRFIAMMVLAASFVTMLILVWHGDTNVWDQAIRRWAIGLNTPMSIAAWEDISFLGSVAFLSCLTFLSLTISALRRDWYAVRLMAVAMGGAVGLDTTLKWLVHRPRPDEVYVNTMPASFSFPSGHALYGLTFYFTLAIILCRIIGGKWTWSIWVATIVIVALIGASRIFLGVHYGSDVLGGYLIAATWQMVILSPAGTPQPNTVIKN